MPAFASAVVFQPPYSPDLNPIEHVWARIKKMLAGRIMLTTPSLTRAVLEAWREISEDRQFLHSLCASMPRRLTAVIDADGGPTRY